MERDVAADLNNINDPRKTDMPTTEPFNQADHHGCTHGARGRCDFCWTDEPATPQIRLGLDLSGEPRKAGGNCDAVCDRHADAHADPSHNEWPSSFRFF